MKMFEKVTQPVKKASSKAWDRMKKFMVRFPIWTLVIILALMLLFIAAGNAIRKPKVEEVKPVVKAKTIETYSIGEAPKLRAQAKVEKSGVIKIVAQTSGIVQNIRFKEGQTVGRGATLTNISTNYQGGNISSVQRQIAEKQYFNAKDTLDTQKDVIGKQRAIADKTDENSDKLREISKQSIDETKSLLDLNNSIISTIDTNLNQYTATNSGSVNDAAIQALKLQKVQLQSSTNSLNSALRNLDYTTKDDNAPAQLANISRELTQKQLDLQQKTVELNVEISHLQYNSALISESLSYPAAPCAGIIEKVHVKFGQNVTPGTVLFTLSTNEKSAMAVALVSKDVALNVSKIEPSIIHSGGKTLSLLPSYVSAEATDGTLYSVYYALPEEYITEYGNDSYLQVDVPVGYSSTNSTDPYVPLDAIHQTQDESIIYVMEKGKARAKKVQLGQVFGQYVEVISGLGPADQVILSRDVLDDELVKTN
jgi:multidrug efflux pump subunit AcrA (membrane-fusion protein)